MDKMVELTTYDGSPYVTLHVLGQSLDFEIPQDAGGVFETTRKTSARPVPACCDQKNRPRHLTGGKEE